MRLQLKRLLNKEQTVVKGSSNHEETKVSNKFGFITDEESEEYQEAEPEAEFQLQKPTPPLALKAAARNNRSKLR
jgi:hypothetical protein